MNPITPGVGADEEDEVAGAARGRPGQLAVLHHSDTHRIDEAVGPVRLVEIQLAADRRDTDAIAIAADPRDHAVEEVALMGLVEWAEPQ